MSAMNVAVCLKQIPDRAGRRPRPRDATRSCGSESWCSTTPIPTGSRWPSSSSTARGGARSILVSMAPTPRRAGFAPPSRWARRVPCSSATRAPRTDALGTAKVLAAAIAGSPRPRPRRHRVDRRLHRHAARPARRAPRPPVDHLCQARRDRRFDRPRPAPDRVRLRRGREPAAGAPHGHRRRRRAALPLVQGDHGRQVQARRELTVPISASPPPRWAGRGATGDPVGRRRGSAIQARSSKTRVTARRASSPFFEH